MSRRQIVSRENRIVFENAPPDLEFRNLADELATMTAAHGVVVRPYRSKDLPVFSSLSPSAQIHSLGELRSYVSLCRLILAEGGTLLSSQTFTWRALREMKIIPPSDLFSKMIDSDIIEIHDMNHVGRFRNLNFLRISSYTFEELYSVPWHELFMRVEDNVTEQLLALMQSLVASGERGVVETGIGAQHVREVASAARHTFEAQVKRIAILYGRDDKPAGYIAIESAKIVDQVYL